jgi:hypothetical protein
MCLTIRKRPSNLRPKQEDIMTQKPGIFHRPDHPIHDIEYEDTSADEKIIWWGAASLLCLAFWYKLGIPFLGYVLGQLVGRF